MGRTYKLLAVFIFIAFLQIFVPAKMILDREVVLNSGTEYKFKTAPVDPTDPFRGKYVRLNYKERRVDIDNESNWTSGDDIYITLSRDKNGFAKIKSISKEPSPLNEDYFKAIVSLVTSDGSNKLTISYPFNRFYMKESKALAAENAYRKSQADTSKVTYALVNIKDGKAVLKDVLIDGISLKDIVSEK